MRKGSLFNKVLTSLHTLHIWPTRVGLDAFMFQREERIKMRFELAPCYGGFVFE